MLKELRRSVPKKYLAFDVETAKEFPIAESNWRSYRPLGIVCIASLKTDETEPRVWLSRGTDGKCEPQMSKGDVVAFLQFLFDTQRSGYTPLSWNGLGFDLDILSEESDMLAECKRLALAHVDMMFHVVCEKGFPVSLGAAADGLRLPGKLRGVEGIRVPNLWASGQHETVIEYVSQDVRTTLAVARESERRKEFVWTTGKGKPATLALRRGWLSVEEALKLPFPDTSWMTKPPSRQSFMGWI